MADTKVRSVISAKAARALLFCGILAGPFFSVVAIIQILIRPAFNIETMAVRALSLGKLEWMQIASFIITGILALLFVVLGNMEHALAGLLFFIGIAAAFGRIAAAAARLRAGITDSAGAA